MITSSAFVIAALTMTGLFMRENESQDRQDGYTIDFDALQNQASLDAELAQGSEESQEGQQQERNNGRTAIINAPKEESQTDENAPADDTPAENTEGNGLANLEDDLDYLPGDEELVLNQEVAVNEEQAAQMAEEPAVEQPQVTAAESTEVRNLNFSAEQGLAAPVNGGILMHYSMDQTTYFKTLDQYKYNPAVVFSAVEGDTVIACAEGKVVNIFENEEIGHAVTLDLGNGYEATYGQLQGIAVNVGDYVNAAESFAAIAAPTIYYTLEGTNLYFALTKDGEAVNPETMLP